MAGTNGNGDFGMDDSISEAASMVAEVIRRRGLGRMQAINELWGQLKLDREEVIWLAKEHLARLVGECLTGGVPLKQRDLGVTIPYLPDVDFKSPLKGQGIPESIRVLRNTCFTVADGTTRQLLQFRKEDVEFVIDVRQNQIDGLKRHIKAFREIGNTLDKFDVDSVEELDMEQKERLSEMWVRVTQPKREKESEVA